MELSEPGLQNAMLRFEPISEKHRDVVFDSEIEESVWKWMPALRGGSNLGVYFDFILKTQKAGLAATFVLFRQSDGVFAGITGFNDINKIHRRVRNAIAWHPPVVATSELYQAGQLSMMKRAYEWRAKRLEWQLNPDNSYIMEQVLALGPTREAYFRNFERSASGAWVDKIVYSMTRPELAEAIQSLETKLFA